MIEFKLPNAETRYKLWKSILPEEAKADPDIDFDFFAKEFELSPSSIKEILLNSAYIAAAENVEISNRTIFKAIKNNFSKYNKVLSKTNMGIYFDILD
jgi:ATP-dependent 26S proteasome regulatory subunit